MPIFYLHIRTGDQIIPDIEGIELPDLAKAEEQSIFAARELIRDQVLRGEVNMDQSIEIYDSDGKRLGNVPFADALVVRSASQLSEKP